MQSGLDQALIDELVALIGGYDYEPSLSDLKQHYPKLPLVVCSEDDMFDREPFAQHQGYDLHLMAQGMGCAQLTHSLDIAAGVVVAFHVED